MRSQVDKVGVCGQREIEVVLVTPGSLDTLFDSVSFITDVLECASFVSVVRLEFESIGMGIHECVLTVSDVLRGVSIGAEDILESDVSIVTGCVFEFVSVVPLFGNTVLF